MTESALKNNQPYRVLTLDGGGMRGLYTATVLHTLMKRYLPSSDAPDADIGKGFDLIVGTSTGGILAAALAKGVSTKKVLDFYAQYGSEIFPDPKPDDSIYGWAYRNRSKPAGNSEKLKEKLTSIFQQDTILSMYKKRKVGLCIPTVNVLTNKAWVFKTPHNPQKHRDDNYKIVDVCLATSAAPIFFPLVKLTNPDTQIGYDVFADGGLWANNPVLIGLVEALEMSGDRPVEIISVGTCPPPSGQVIDDENLGRGLKQWMGGVKIVETSLDAQASGHQFIASFIANKLSSLGKKCTIIRLPQNPPSSEQIKFLGLDKSSKEAINVLSQLGKTDGEAAHSWSLPGGAYDKDFLKDIFINLPPVVEG